ncbi:uncharacterized protein FIBRA_03228 [Fibroporia radiculosa]|uniref:Uncharacterized protein n=1 Tax=Fibroporia radiculosa TaxID=599839 RepID=J4GND1_9APHY|nr:uncharacterized protein FIBRA_03228 [Fibroporia radiculosa]CCM01180.1 predicted protein [Fibroporia radiculosa]
MSAASNGNIDQMLDTDSKPINTNAHESMPVSSSSEQDDLAGMDSSTQTSPSADAPQAGGAQVVVGQSPPKPSFKEEVGMLNESVDLCLAK